MARGRTVVNATFVYNNNHYRKMFSYNTNESTREYVITTDFMG